jgi:ankyrin repeat protein
VTSISSLFIPCICFQTGTTPFHEAAVEGRLDAMKYLVELGAKYDEKNNVSDSILICIHLSFCLHWSNALHYCLLALSLEQLHLISLLSEGMLTP